MVAFGSVLLATDVGSSESVRSGSDDITRRMEAPSGHLQLIADHCSLKDIFMSHKVTLIPGDGIGPEVMAEAKRVIEFFSTKGPDKFETEEALAGGCCYDAHGVAITDATME